MLCLRKIANVVLVSFVLTACGFLRDEPELPSPEAKCPVTLDWRGVISGQSTKQDVIELLGQPKDEGEEQKGDELMPFYAYDIEGGVIANYVQDRVFFRSDGVVDWVEIVVADRDGRFRAVSETVDLLGNILDTAYINTQADMGGPDQLYVWSECGLALDTDMVCAPTETGELACWAEEYFLSVDRPISTTLQFRYPIVEESAGGPNLAIDNAVLMKFLFPPTSYEGYLEFYKEKVPFGWAFWDPYLRAIELR